MFQAFKDIWTIIQTDPATVKGVCFLPPPPAPVVKVAPPAPPPSVFVIDQDRNHYGFRMDKDSDREGAVKWLTGLDGQILKDRKLGSKKNANAECKAFWFTGETVAEVVRLMRYSPSWVEKRFAAFSSALLQEKGVAA
jgi:hypothetical protein